MKDSRTQTVIDALIHKWISLYGVPETITSDRGSHLLSQEWKDLLKFLGIRHIHTTACYPQSNRIAERTTQIIKKSLRAMLKDITWYNYLPLTMLDLRSQTKEDLTLRQVRQFLVQISVYPGNSLNLATYHLRVHHLNFSTPKVNFFHNLNIVRVVFHLHVVVLWILI